MREILTISEIEALYNSEWVLVEIHKRMNFLM